MSEPKYEPKSLLEQDTRMDAYYYGFAATTDPGVNAVLSAVAYAGKGFHSTEMWDEPMGFDSPLMSADGSFEGLIQAAAEMAADAHAAEIRRAKAEAIREAAEAWQVETEGVRPGPWNFMRRRADEIEAAP